MIRFTDCKINIGLYVTERRPDGYHNLLTCMVHVPWHDILEIIPSQTGRTTLTVLGNKIDCPPQKNIVMKAYAAMKVGYDLPDVEIVLQKIIPDGAGLGGGSADAAHTLLLLNDMFGCNATPEELAGIAVRIGADCPFFVYDTPMICTGIGEVMEPANINLSGYTILIAKPLDVNISTKEAYAGITPAQPVHDLKEALAHPVNEWQSLISNDFEASIFPKAPQIAHLKEMMLEHGAVYAAMSGSGASVFGIFDSDKLAESAAAHVKELPHFIFRP